MRKIASHLLLFFFTILLGFSVVSKPVEANVTDWWRAQFSTEGNNIRMEQGWNDQDINQEKNIAENVGGLIGTLNTHILGPGGNTPQAAMLRETVGPGLIGSVNGGIVAMFTPPASAQSYMADVLQNAKIIPQAQAQGLGFASLDPVLDTWKQFRNVAYLFFVVIFLVIGFMIMFRTKIGQAAITVQQAIPSIIVTLLAVTFSYAIAGFLIDIMYVLMYMISGLFSQGPELIEKNIFNLVVLILSGTGGDVTEVVSGLMGGLLGSSWATEVLSYISSALGALIVGIAILISTFKIFLELLKSYISIILQVVFAPVILMMGAIPGKNVFTSWIKNIAGNLLMWPTLLLCLIVNRMLTAGTVAGARSEVGGFMPPFLLGQGQGSIFPALVGIGILLVIPEIMKEVKKKMGVDDGIFGSLAGTAWGRVKDAWKPTKKAAGFAALAPLNTLAGLRAGEVAGSTLGHEIPGVTRDKGKAVGRTIGTIAGLAGAPTKIVSGTAKDSWKNIKEGGYVAAFNNLKNLYGQITAIKNYRNEAGEDSNSSSENISNSFPSGPDRDNEAAVPGNPEDQDPGGS